tara:strand:- start:747 stop:1289 length:543 start_codon:yes stop_codon:yes gene_type:complete
MADAMTYRGQDIDEYIQVLLEKDDVTEDDIDFLEFLMAVAAFDVVIFVNRINQVATLLAEIGIAESQVASIIARDFATTGRIFSELDSATARIVRFGIKEASRLGMMSIYNSVLEGDPVYRWIVARGVKHCEDCEERAGEEMRFSEWTRLGLPATGWSRCGFRCYCILDPVGNIDSKVDV